MNEDRFDRLELAMVDLSGRTASLIEVVQTLVEQQKRPAWLSQRYFAVVFCLSVLLSAYVANVSSRVFVTQCVDPATISATRAAVCDSLFPFDAEITPRP